MSDHTKHARPAPSARVKRSFLETIALSISENNNLNHKVVPLIFIAIGSHNLNVPPGTDQQVQRAYSAWKALPTKLRRRLTGGID